MLGFSSPAAAAYLSPDDAALYRDAFAALKSGRGQDATRIVSLARDRTLQDVVAGLALAQDDNPFDFATTWSFLERHSSWPENERREIAAAAEKRMSGQEGAQALLEFFKAYPAQTGDGFMRYVQALNYAGRSHEIPEIVRQHWRETSMGDKEQEVFLHNFGHYLSKADTWTRLDSFLWRNMPEQAEQLYPLVSPGEKALARARLALAGGDKKAPRLVAQVPSSFANDPGLLFERARWRRVKSNDSEGALAFLRRARARSKGMPSRWWSERGNVARELLNSGAARDAYKLASTHGLDDGSDFADAEFLSGWIALRYLREPQTAFRHFQKLMTRVASPISMARGAYWSGRALESQGNGEEATSWYRRAVSYGTTFYGQLAAFKLNPQNRISTAVAPLSPDALESFAADVPATTVAQLLQLGEKQRALDFALGYVADAKSATPYRLMAGIAMQAGANDIAVKISKSAAKENIALLAEGYPVLPLQAAVGAPLVHALIRQESQFDVEAVSRSNAQGLMQLLSSTARHVNNKHGLGLDAGNLFDPETNIQLGSTYIGEMLDDFNGYLPLAIAAYNAGPSRVRQWLETMGDPRGHSTEEVIDWLERIPYDETRNYVQRVLEALQLYRAKFSGGAALLALNDDLSGLRVAQNEE